ncbi:PP2C family protein-serine/threonine phosphatase [Actinomycetospora sp. C-140]
MGIDADEARAPARSASAARLFEPDADAAFERLARLATSLTGAPAGAVWLVQDDRVVRRSVHDTAGSTVDPGELSTPAERSRCGLVLRADDPVWVDDVTDVTPHGATAAADPVRAWAGCPIRDTAGTVIGVLGVLDVRARPWSSHQRDVLTTLAQAATGEVALRTALADSRADRSLAVRQAVRSDQDAREAGRQAQAAGAQARQAGAAARYYEARARSASAQAATSDQLAAEAQRLAGLAEQHAAEAEELAATLRQSLLPARLPAFPGVEVAARYRPGTGGSVLGDFYDLFPTPDGWGAVIGDVCGKGPHAARTTALARSTVRALGHTDDDPGSVLAALHGVLHVWFDERPSFATVAYAGITPRPADDGLDVRLASAGHTPAVVYRKDGTIDVLEAGGRALGIRPEPRIAVEPVTLDVGDRLLLYTDGVTEARPTGGREFELDGLLGVLRSLPPDADEHAVADAVLAAVDDHAAGAALDDTALLVVRAGRR